jgi:hypothetical protein
MGCNAWNHPPNCDCGWGGVFYGIGVKTEKYYWQVSDSYTNPNATCPTCRTRVFYYESPFGGKVYFDHMGPPWPKHPCMDLHQAKKQTKFGTEQTPLTNKLKTPNYQIEDGWRPVYCAEIKNSTELTGCIVFSFFEPENRKLLYAKHTSGGIDARSPILIRRVKDTKQYEISTLSSREKSPSELRLLAFTSIAELKIFDIKAQRIDDSSKIHKSTHSINNKKNNDAQPTKRKIQFDPNHSVKITVVESRKKLTDQVNGISKIKLENNLLDQKRPSTARAKRRAEILEKRHDRKIKREIREIEEKNNAKQLKKTALEYAFEKASIGIKTGDEPENTM